MLAEKALDGILLTHALGRVSCDRSSIFFINAKAFIRTQTARFVHKRLLKFFFKRFKFRVLRFAFLARVR